MMLLSRLNVKLWIGLIFASLHLLVRLTASTSQPSSPVPTLGLLSRSRDSAVLVCRAPAGLKGVHFELYRVKDKMDSRSVPVGAEEAHFTVRLSESSQPEYYCCLYKTPDGKFSAFSPYYPLDQQRDADPNQPFTPNPGSPILSVEPSNGLVKRGDTLLFRCSLPPPLPQFQGNSNSRPVSFMLLRGATVDAKGLTSVVPQSQSSPSRSSEPQPGVFSVGPVTGTEQGQYTCLFQISRGGQLQNSTLSNIVTITLTDLLPTPSLVLQLQSDIWHLVCRGSPSYPGAVFSLYLADTAQLVASYQAKVTQHQAIFSVPVQDTPVVLFQCEYSVLLGREWTKSERSLPLSVAQDRSHAPTKDPVSVNWPLIVGSFSAVVLFLCAAALVIVLLHRKVKAAAEAKKEREGAQFWTHVHGKDHIVDLTLRRSSFSSHDWSSGHAEPGSRSNLWSPLSTFSAPIIPNY